MTSNAAGLCVDPEVMKAATFCIQQEGGLGVFYTPTLAVISNMSVPEGLLAGSTVEVVSPRLDPVPVWFTLEIVARNSEKNFAILKSATPHAFIPVCVEPADKLLGEGLCFASFSLGVEFCPMSRRKLGFTTACPIWLSQDKQFLLYTCVGMTKDSDNGLILKDGELVGLHQGSISMLLNMSGESEESDGESGEEDAEFYRIGLDLKLFVKETIAKGLSQGCVALLAHRFAGLA